MTRTCPRWIPTVTYSSSSSVSGTPVPPPSGELLGDVGPLASRHPRRLRCSRRVPGERARAATRVPTRDRTSARALRVALAVDRAGSGSQRLPDRSRRRPGDHGARQCRPLAQRHRPAERKHHLPASQRGGRRRPDRQRGPAEDGDAAAEGFPRRSARGGQGQGVPEPVRGRDRRAQHAGPQGPPRGQPPRRYPRRSRRLHAARLRRDRDHPHRGVFRRRSQGRAHAPGGRLQRARLRRAGTAAPQRGRHYGLRAPVCYR